MIRGLSVGLIAFDTSNLENNHGVHLPIVSPSCCLLLPFAVAGAYGQKGSSVAIGPNSSCSSTHISLVLCVIQTADNEHWPTLYNASLSKPKM